MPKTKKQFYIITGFSGSGKTTALRCFEEQGFYCVDNLPASLLHGFTTLLKANKDIKKIAVVIDARGKDFMKTLEKDIKILQESFHLRILFFETSLEVVIKRFKESRLKHPLSLNGSIRAGFNQEQIILNVLRQHSNLVINTSLLNVHAHKSLIQKYILRDEKNVFEVYFMSFGFKYGIPQEADIVIDVRFLVNPYFDPKLKSKNGTHKPVQDFIKKEKNTKEFLTKTKSYLEYLIKQYKNEGKSYVKIAFGCTGGQHRSVTVAEEFINLYNTKKKYTAKVEHRDIHLSLKS